MKSQTLLLPGLGSMGKSPGLSEHGDQTLLTQLPPRVKRAQHGASLVAQWLSVSLPMQGTRVRALLWEDPTCRGATRPVSHNY